MKNILLVGSGGFVGSVVRYKIGALCLRAWPGTQFPWGTFAVNIAGCLLVGVIAAALEHCEIFNAELRLLLITGFLGGFTTFSAFGLETAALMRAGSLAMALEYALASVGFGLLAVWLGMKAGGAFSG